MTLRMEQVLEQLPEAVTRFREQMAGRDAGLREAETALTSWSEDPETGDRRIEQAMAESSRPYATSLGEAPGFVRDAPVFSPVTVVAADGSSIEPDRFAAAQCFVVNTGYVVLPYGNGVAPELSANARLGPEVLLEEGDDHGRDDLGPFSWGVNLQRDVRELETGAQVATALAGDVVLLLDGTLLPWDLDSTRVAESIRKNLSKRTEDALCLLKAAGPSVSMGAYISGSRASDVVTSLRALAGNPATSWPLSDSQVFGRTLGEGQRSALFRARSERATRVEQGFETEHPVCFFYVRIGDDIARVELPGWAASPEQVDRLHATLVQQCADCGGYPRALQEAHEQAVISMGDRQQFDRLLDGEAMRQGLAAQANSKRMSKRRRGI